MLEAPLDILGRDRRSVVEFDPRTQVEGAALGIFGKIEILGQCRVVVFLLAEVLISASCSAIRKLSGVAVPSCCCGSSQRAAMLVCQASTIFPLGTIVGAARTLRAAGIASTVVANATVRSTLRRVSGVLFILPHMRAV